MPGVSGGRSYGIIYPLCAVAIAFAVVAALVAFVAAACAAAAWTQPEVESDCISNLKRKNLLQIWRLCCGAFVLVRNFPCGAVLKL